MKNKNSLVIILIILCFACNKAYLDIKPDKKLTVPTTLDDFQAMLDNNDVMNTYTPGLGEVSADDYYVLYDRWNLLTQPEQKNGYIWAKDFYQGSTSLRDDWTGRYQQVFYANCVLEGLQKLNASNQADFYNNIKGSALFMRGFAFYQLAQLFCGPFDKNTTNAGAGIHIRLTADLNAPITRESIAQSYQQILSDVKEAISLLPFTSPYKTRPVKASAYALLSRVYLTMQDYDNALRYADSVINGNVNLLDFNKLNTAASFPMQRFNQEVIFHSTMTTFTILLTSRLIIDSTLYKSYHNNDLRKTAWFRNNAGNWTYKGSYDGSSTFFSGLAIDECYLTKAECLARKGDSREALNVLNTLLTTRFKTGTYMPLTATNDKEALQIILNERRKELLFRGIRWSDLRRNNLDPTTATTLSRVLNGITYTLKPNSSNYTLPIRDNVIQMSGIQQNPRE